MTNRQLDREFDNALCRNFDPCDEGVICPQYDHGQYIGGIRQEPPADAASGPRSGEKPQEVS